ncbi:hypothetical protein CISIN_1g0069271mg, partial [Citrus sinensis]
MSDSSVQLQIQDHH